MNRRMSVLGGLFEKTRAVIISLSSVTYAYFTLVSIVPRKPNSVRFTSEWWYNAEDRR